MTVHRFRPLALFTAAIALASSGLAHAGSGEAWSERGHVKIMGFDAGSRFLFDARGELVENGQGRPLVGRDVASDTRARAMVSGELRLGGRHRLQGALYRIDGGNDIAFEASAPNGLPVGNGTRADVSGRYDVDFRLARLMYEYALVETPSVLVGLSGGLHWARIAGEGRATAIVDWNGRSDTFTGDGEHALWRVAPSLGVRVAAAPHPRWRLGVEAQGFDTRWGNFTSERGHYERFGLSVEYRARPNLGIHMGYDWFRLKYTDDFSSTLPEQDVSLSGRARGELRVDGPTLGLVMAF